MMSLSGSCSVRQFQYSDANFARVPMEKLGNCETIVFKHDGNSCVCHWRLMRDIRRLDTFDVGSVRHTLPACAV